MCALYFLNGVTRLPFTTDKAIKEHLRVIYRIWAQNFIVERCSELLEAGVVTPQQVNAVRENHMDDVRTIRPQLLTIVESAQVSDNTTSSAIAPANGALYENMLEAAREARLNEKDKINGFDEYLKPLLVPRL